MKKYIAYCGLDCKKCEARIATVNNDDALRENVAKLWSKLNGIAITPDMIHCTGCRIDGVKTVYSDALCPIRKCAAGKKLASCGKCEECKSCEKLGAILQNSEEARRDPKA